MASTFFMFAQEHISLGLHKSPNANYSPAMESSEKEQLAMTGRADREAASLRAKAARLAIAMSQPELGEAIGRQKAVISNIEQALSFPSRDLMVYLFKEHRIDLNFMVLGHYAQLPSDVQDRLFDALRRAHRELGLQTG